MRHITFASKNLLRRPVRSLLTIAGVALAVAVAVSLGGFNLGYRQALDRSIERLGFQIMIMAKGCPYEAATMMLKGGTGLLYLPGGVFDKVKGAFGFDDIDFESEEFSRRFWVQSSDKRFAYDVLHPRMMEFLLRELDSAIDLEGGAICVADGSSRWEPSSFRSQLDFVVKFCELWPRHLLADLAK